MTARALNAPEWGTEEMLTRRLARALHHRVRVPSLRIRVPQPPPPARRLAASCSFTALLAVPGTARASMVLQVWARLRGTAPAAQRMPEISVVLSLLSTELSELPAFDQLSVRK